MKYVMMRDENTDEILKLGRFGGAPDFVDQLYSFTQNDWVRDNTLYGDLFDGLLKEISKAEADRLIAAHFSREKQAA